MRANSALPPAQGLYLPRFEHDSCGVNFVCHLKGEASHRIVELGLGALCRMQHRGALGAEENTGDGAGILLQVPDAFYRQVLPFELPEAGSYATGIAFLPAEPDMADRAIGMVDEIIRQEGLEILGWRDLPIDDSDRRRRTSRSAHLPAAVPGRHPGRRRPTFGHPPGSSGVRGPQAGGARDPIG